MNRCMWCGKEFERRSSKGPIPKYCSASCRQRAYEARQAVKSATELSQAWTADITRTIEQMTAWSELQHQAQESLRPTIDVSTLLTQFEIPNLLTDDTARLLSQATSAARVFEQMTAWSELQHQAQESLRSTIDVSTLLTQFEIPNLLTDDLMWDISRAYRRLEASIPDGDLMGLLAAPTSSDTKRPETRQSLGPGPEAQIAVLLLACVAVIMSTNAELAKLSVVVLSEFVHTGVVASKVALVGYERLSDELPNDNVLAWAFALAAALRSLRRSKD